MAEPIIWNNGFPGWKPFQSKNNLDNQSLDYIYTFSYLACNVSYIQFNDHDKITIASIY